MARPPLSPFLSAGYWLTWAMLVGRLLPRSVNPPARLSAGETTTPSRARIVSPEWVGRLPGVRWTVEAVGARARGAFTADEELAVPRAVEVVAVAALTLLALLLRVWNLPESPVGIHGDETEMALEALRSIRGESLGIWTGVTLGNPSGYAYWMALLFRLGEADVATMRLASAIPGAAIIPVGYILVRSLFPFRVALLSAVLATFSFFFVIQSRIAFGGITSVFMALLAMWLIVRAVQSRSWPVAVLAGVALGLGLYTFKAFLLYYGGIWAVALLSAAMNREVRQGKELWLCLATSAAVGAPMLLFYANSGYIGANLNDLYQVSLSDPSTWLKVPGLALDAVLLANQPVQGNTIDGSPAIPALPLAASIFFWAGLAAALLFIRQRRCQLLLAGWLVGMAPILLVPGAESRRYLLGIFFVLVIVAIGVDAALIPAGRRLREYLAGGNAPAALARWVAIAVGTVAVIAFAGLFAGQSLREYGRWGDGESVRWFFNYEYHQSLLFLEDLDTDLPVRYYTVRQHFDNSIRRFMLPGLRGGDGGEPFGGDGAIPPRGESAEDSIFMLLDQYLPLAETLEAEYPEAVRIGEGTKDGRTLYVAYLVPGRGR